MSRHETPRRERRHERSERRVDTNAKSKGVVEPARRPTNISDWSVSLAAGPETLADFDRAIGGLHAQIEAVQLKSSGGPAAADPQAAARAGLSGAGGALPFRDKIQAAFGRHDVSRVRAFGGAAAAQAGKSLGAYAFASGESVAFARAPDLHTAAHEAAHVVQQRAGVSLSGGVGRVGDVYERHADRVADAVVRGHSVEGLLGPLGRDGRGGGRAAVQRVADPEAGEGQQEIRHDEFIQTTTREGYKGQGKPRREVRITLNFAALSPAGEETEDNLSVIYDEGFKYALVNPRQGNPMDTGSEAYERVEQRSKTLLERMRASGRSVDPKRLADAAQELGAALHVFDELIKSKAAGGSPGTGEEWKYYNTLPKPNRPGDPPPDNTVTALSNTTDRQSTGTLTPEGGEPSDPRKPPADRKPPPGEPPGPGTPPGPATPPATEPRKDPPVAGTEPSRPTSAPSGARVSFLFGRDDLTAEAKATLKALAERHRDDASTIKIDAYADAIGSDASNLALSHRRGAAVKAYLVAGGIAAWRLETHDHGESGAQATTDRKSGNAPDRRVELTIMPARRGGAAADKCVPS